MKMDTESPHTRQDPAGAADRPSSPPLDPVYNERGIIAYTYYDLQGLGVLDAARRAYPLPRASPESTLRAVFQGVEVALLNLDDITGRAVADLEREATDGAVVKMFWARGFHRLLTALSLLPSRLGLGDFDVEPPGRLRVADSPAFQSYLETLRRLDREVMRASDQGRLEVDEALANRSLESPVFNLLHLLRVCNHEATIWERNLEELAVPVPVPSYAEFVVAEGMRDAVYDRVLKGDTYFTQFRGLHQIPETLGEEANDLCEEAIRHVQTGRLRRAVELLGRVNVLAEVMAAALPPMADNLATSDYHQIRENLGLTSGSHSICLRFHMFTDLYEQLWEAVGDRLAGQVNGKASEQTVTAGLREAARRRHDDPDQWVLHLLANECLKLRAAIFYWRDEHVHMPRNNLGGDSTKSLTGSPDAVKAVKHMRSAARAKDPMIPLAQARGVASGSPNGPPGALTRYLGSSESLDAFLQVRTGAVTQARFHDVQERLGFFANRCPFSPPERRQV